ncbi:MarR family winged helix-turn-helix transcriptional regulator [Gordonia soli]|uniref:Putative MarR family transcriptional regulator n=1 Tax=Gordonia soli NBRC 108243 TaxID=1223545 RepID=M0QP87_9ACTN|nr:MarR family winged helix-turn-helix transcriptional regulator [Gordonia soli]GAC70091.1 putative MarR family transcriptional regulator [Gordonia soli NBRC 108243]
MGSDDPIADLEEALVDMWRRGRIRTRERAQAIDPRLDPACYPLLMVLMQRGQVPMSAIIAELGIEKSTLTRQIDSVVRLGLVERQPDPDDARVRLVSLTAKGRRRLDKVSVSAIADWRDRLSRWEPTDVRRLTELLGRLAEDSG